MYRVATLILAVILFAKASAGETNEEKTVLLGMSTALTGPTSFLGRQMRAGIEVYLHRTNLEGGVQGRRVALVPLDDGYRKDIAEMNMRHLLKRRVLAFIGNVGTPTAAVTLPLAKKHRCMFFGAYTGSTHLRNEFPDEAPTRGTLSHVANYRASYYDELNKIFHELFRKGIHPIEIGLFAQKGEWGKELIGHVKRIYRKNGYSSVTPVVGLYKRNTIHIKEAVFRLMEPERNLRAVILAAPYSPSAKCLQTLKPVLPNAMFFGISFMGIESFIDVLKKDAEGVVVTQVVPCLLSEVPVVRRFKRDLNRFALSAACKKVYGSGMDCNQYLTHVALEGYIAATLLIKVLRHTDDLDTPGSVIKAMDKFDGRPLDVGIFKNKNQDGDSPPLLKWNALKRQFCSHVWTGIVKNGRVEPFNWDDFLTDRSGNGHE